MKVYCIADNIISPLGSTSHDNYLQVVAGNSGIQEITALHLLAVPFYASQIATLNAYQIPGYTRFEQLCIASISGALQDPHISLTDSDTVLILSSTKGNIELIEGGSMAAGMIERISLSKTATRIGQYFHAKNPPIVVSNACISGVLAIIVAKRMLESTQYKHAIVVGADVLSKFVLSGFQSLMAMSDVPCRPFDRDRKGINIGEGAATMILTTDDSLVNEKSVVIAGEGLSNDANHISGPSRTGAELAHAVGLAMKGSAIEAQDLAFVSAHGTATIYNDEMESKAFDLAGLSEVPLHSLKGYYGHTLGAAGVIECVLSIHSLQNEVVLASKNYAQSGVSKALCINTSVLSTTKRYALKTASGFGGCNVAVVLRKISL